MFSKRIDTWLKNKNTLRCLFIAALAVSLAAGAALFDAFRTMVHISFSAGLPSITFALILILALLLAAFYLARKISACKMGISDFVAHCKHIDVDTLTDPYAPEHTCDDLDPLFSAHNKMLARLHESTSRIRQFSGDASHELRTPLTIVRGETEVALRWGKTADDYRNTLISNMEEIERMGRIIEDLLTLAKSESGELPLSITTLSLSDLLQEMYLQARKLGLEKNIEVHLQHEADKEIWLKGDDLRLRQMFWNLISNALRYTPENGHVYITLECHESNAIVTISDTGIGIEPEHIENIYERFYRTDAARNRSDGGTGLGLAIVKWVVEAHHGNIEVTSEVNRGSSFCVTLPLG
ncbi:MAG: sensor histidine kinase [Thermodesulfobacteriota bacterium]